MALTTFSLEACKRIQEVLGETVEVHAFWEKHDESTWVVVCGAVGYEVDEAVPAYRLDDLSAEVWVKIGEKKGWKNVGEWIRWRAKAVDIYKAFLSGGYEKASQKMLTILK